MPTTIVNNLLNQKHEDQELQLNTLADYFASKKFDGGTTRIVATEISAPSEPDSSGSDSGSYHDPESATEGGFTKLNIDHDLVAIQSPNPPPAVDKARPAAIDSTHDTSNNAFDLQKSPVEFDVRTPDIPTTYKAAESFSIDSVTEVVSKEEAAAENAEKVLRIIETYGINYEKPEGSWKGLKTFVPIVKEQMEKGEPVRMILPAFPCKSPNNKDKVLGILPDLGEELALAHLNGLCESIAEIYEHGAEVHITSDGLVYNDLLGVSDETVWDYGEALRHMALEKELHHVKFIRLWDLLDHPGPQDDNPVNTKAFYLAHSPCFRREMMYRYEDKNLDADKAIKTDMDTCLTYRGYIKFLTKDLAHQENYKAGSAKGKAALISQTAKKMIVRGRMFAAAIKASRKDFVRLSIHDSGGEGKLSMSLIPQARGSLGLTPWHSSLAIGIDGSYRTVHANDVRETHEIIYKHGQPYYFREKSDLFDWSSAGLIVKFEHLYPTGIIIRPGDVDDARPPPSITTIPMKKVRDLSNNFSPIVLRGFAETTDEQLYEEKANELGTILPWSFGNIQKVKDQGRADRMGNNVTSNEAMPMHFDGMFKFVDETDPITGETVKVQKPPGYQYFTCLATAPKGSGYTLFASARHFWRYLPAPWSVARLEPIKWAMDNDGFWDAKLKNLPLVVRHPVTGLPCVRWHQPWDATKTKFSTCVVTIENDEQELVPIIDRVLYDQRVCLRFTWEKGDLLISDNTSMLHTRTGYKSNCDRELWRIHFD